jgi:hypothetical protein
MSSSTRPSSASRAFEFGSTNNTAHCKHDWRTTCGAERLAVRREEHPGTRCRRYTQIERDRAHALTWSSKGGHGRTHRR